MDNEKRIYLIMEMFYLTGNEIIFSEFNQLTQVSSRYLDPYFKEGFCQRQILFDGYNVYRYEIVESPDGRINHVAHRSCINYKGYEHIRPIMEKELIEKYGENKYRRYVELVAAAYNEIRKSPSNEFYSFSIPPIEEYNENLEHGEVFR